MNTKKLNILFVSSEVDGFSKTGGLADVAKSLPIELQNLGHRIKIVTPFYRTLEHRKDAKLKHSAVLNNCSTRPDINFKVQELALEGIPVLCIDNNHYFDRLSFYGEDHQAYPDNGERFAFFCLAALQICELEDFTPDIIHCNDWHTGLIPYLLKTKFQDSFRFVNSKTVLTTHNAAYQGVFEKTQLNLIPEISSCMNEKVLENHRYLNFLKVGLIYADKINTVSPNYASELLTHLGSSGLCQIFLERVGDFEGILNGCDYNDWNSETDTLIPANFNIDDLSGKLICKNVLQEELGLEQSKVPLFSMICRLTDQKGFSLLVPILEQFLQHKVQLVIIGTGDPAIAGHLHAMSIRFPSKFKFINSYSHRLAHMLEAAADFFIMPSIFEPCGLNQFYSLAYGTLPIVRAVGGLKDTVLDYGLDQKHANGFIFYEPTPCQLLHILRRALLLYNEYPEEIKRLMLQAMKSHFYWSDSAKQYELLYLSALK